MRFICIAHTPVKVDDAVKFVASHSGSHAAYLVKLAKVEDAHQCIGIALENSPAGKAFMVEADYENVTRWHLQFLETERD